MEFTVFLDTRSTCICAEPKLRPRLQHRVVALISSILFLSCYRSAAGARPLGKLTVQGLVHELDVELVLFLYSRPLELERRREHPIIHSPELGFQVDGPGVLKSSQF